MKKKIYIRMTVISIVVMLVTMAVTAGMYFKIFSDQIFEDLKTDIEILVETEPIDEFLGKSYVPSIENLRITIIDKNGEVLFDSNADIGVMDNHGDRPEIKEAVENGEGKAVRKSTTLEKNTYYYAQKLDDGKVLRMAKEASNFYEFLLSILPALIAEIIISTLVCLIVAKLLAKKMVEPIEQMAQDLDSDETMKGYEEIQPFLDKIHTQHKELKRSSKMRQDFTANVSHELKTPLASISGYAELIETGIAKDEDVRRFAGEIHKGANRLLAMINDIIELSHLDATDRVKEVESIDLGDEARRIVSMLEVNAQSKDIEIAVTRLDDDCVIEANPQMIEELICNLCDNAIKYNKPGGHVWVSVFNGGDEIIVKIKDDGIGISKEDQARIFERFYRVDKARSNKTGGTGLGLAIVKHIAEQHSAKLVLESKLDKGTAISVIFPNR